jgi:hypothetical protein
MMEQAATKHEIATQSDPGAMTVWSAEAFAQRLAEIDRLKRTVMKPDVDYGKIPGCPKPSLWQPGAEKLMLAFGLSQRITHTEDLSSEDEVRYRTHVEIVANASGLVIGTGVGECSSNEDKYRWRRAVCKQEWDEAPETLRREKWKKYRGQPEKDRQVRTDPTSLVNTILQMSRKRALVSGVRTATAASSVFTDGVEDLQGVMDIENAGANGGEPPIAPPQATHEEGQVPPPPAAAETGEPLITEKQRMRLFAILFADVPSEEAKNARADKLKTELESLGISSSKAIPVSAYEGVVETARQIAELPF